MEKSRSITGTGMYVPAMVQAQPGDDIEGLVQVAQQGDMDAFAKLYRYFANHIFRYACSRVSNRMEAEDIVSYTFRRAWDYLPRYQKGNFRALLYTIAHNVIVDHYRQQYRGGGKLSEQVKDRQPLPDHQLETKEQRWQLYAAIKTLGPGYQDIILLRFIEELSIRETATVLKRSVISIRVGQFKALRKLRGILEQPGRMTKK